MDSRRPGIPSLRGPDTRRGFVRHDLYILLALALLVVAVVVPAWKLHGWRQALLTFLEVVAWITLGVGLLIFATWLSTSPRDEKSLSARLQAALAFLLRALLFGLLGGLLGVALAAGAGYGKAFQDLSTVWGIAMGILLGSLLFLYLGPVRFWPGFRRFCLALLASFIFGILGLLIPGRWGVNIGILIPLAVFLIPALRRQATPPEPPPIAS